MTSAKRGAGGSHHKGFSMKAIIAGLFCITAALVTALSTCLLVAYPFMWIWNYAVVAAITIAKPIEYWVAYWLMLFISMFVAGSRSGKSD